MIRDFANAGVKVRPQHSFKIEVPMASLDKEIAAFEALQAESKPEDQGRWMVIHDDDIEGPFTTFDAAAKVAVDRFGRGPYLIRQLGTQPMALPASVMYAFAHA